MQVMLDVELGLLENKCIPYAFGFPKRGEHYVNSECTRILKATENHYDSQRLIVIPIGEHDGPRRQ